MRNDIIDLSQLRLKKVDYPVTRTVFPEDRSSWPRGEPFPVETTIESGIAFDYNGRTIGFMGTPDRVDSTPVFENTLIAWSAEGHGNVGYDVALSAGGYKIVPNWASSSDAAEIRNTAKFLGSITIGMILPLAGINVAVNLGNAILAPVFGPVPAVAAGAVGQTAISTAFNGGDVEKAVRDVVINLAASQVGGYAGKQAEAATESRLTGKVASAATAAFVGGRDVPQAVGFALLQNGFTTEPAAEESAPAPEEPAPAPATVETSFAAETEMAENPPQTVEGNTMSEYTDLIPDDSGVVDISGVDESYWTGPTSNWWQSNGSDMAAPLTGDAWRDLRAFDNAQAEAPVQATDPLGNTFKDVVTGIGTFGSGVIAIIKTVDKVRNVVTNSRTANANGTVTVALDNGLVVTKDAQGNIIGTARPPVGTGQTTVTGKIIANLGDGTYSLTSPDGTRRVIKYDPQLSSSSVFDALAANPVPVMLAGAGLLAAFIKRR